MFKGGKWWKMDFHLHTPASTDDYGKSATDPEADKHATPKDFLKKCMEEKLDCIAVTDHNNFNWIDNLRNALNELRVSYDDFRELIIFPGVELNVQGNLHALAIFDPSIEIADLQGILGKYDYDSDILATSKSFVEVIDITFKNGGILIPAHVDEDSGILGAATSTLRQILNSDKLLAFEANSEKIEHPIYIESKKNYTLVRGSDSHSLETIGSKYTWVKMGTPSISALKLALHDNDDGVRRSIYYDSNPNDLSNRTYIKSLTISNGKLIGRGTPQKIDFSPWLTTIIGGRGSGKSSIIEYLRLILNKGEELPPVLMKDYNDFRKIPNGRNDLGMLTDETSLKLVICKNGIDYTFEWKDFKTYEINQETGEREEVIDFQERFPVLLFSQKQLYEVSKSPELLFEYLDSSWSSDEWKLDLNEAETEYKKAMSEKRALNVKILAKKSLVRKIADLNMKLVLFESEAIKAVLLKKAQLSDQEKVIESLTSKYQKIIDSVLEMYIELMEIQTITDQDLGSIDSDSQLLLKEWRESISNIVEEILKTLVKFSDVELDSTNLISSLPWNTQKTENQQNLDSAIEQLKETGVENIEQYPVLLAEKESLSQDLKAYDNTEVILQQINTKAEESLDKIYQLYDQRVVEREKVISTWNEQQSDLKIELHPYGDATESEKSLRSIIGKDTEYGRYIADRDGDKLTGGLLHDIIIKDRTSRIEAIKDVKDRLLNIKETDFSVQMRSHLARQYESRVTIKDEFQLWMPTDQISLLLKKEGTNRFESIDAGSAGQRSSALLSLLLRITHGAFIVDQPEDDLDTLKITDLIVKGVNEIKNSRQVVFVTHNPNVVVNTNSEQVNHMDFIRGQICVAHEGALQCYEVRDAICKVMEGGKTALDRRYYRISKALAN